MRNIFFALLLSMAAGGICTLLPLKNMWVMGLFSAAVFILCSTLFFNTVYHHYFSQKENNRKIRFFFCISLFCCLLLFCFTRFTSISIPAFVTLLQNAVLLCTASLGGILLSRGLKRKTELLPVCVVAAWADLCSIHMGPTRSAALAIENYYISGQQAPAPFADFFLFKTFIAGHSLPIPLFGVADWFFAAFLSAALLQLGFQPGPAIMKQTAIRIPRLHAAPTALLTAVLIAQFTGFFIPGLVFIGTAVFLWALLQDRQCIQLSRREWLLTLFFPFITTVTTGLVFR